jgi:hypothetical protein
MARPIIWLSISFMAICTALGSSGLPGRVANSAPMAHQSMLAGTPKQAMPKGNLPGWRQIFTEDFTTPIALGSFPGSAYKDKWAVRGDGLRDTSGHGQYYPSMVLSVAHGMLDIHLHTQNNIHMAAALTPKLTGAASNKGQLYGRYVVRFRADGIVGYKTAWLLWPDDGRWPSGGEIDFPEGDLNKTIHGFVHHMNATSTSDQDWFFTRVRFGSWHTAVTEWSPGKVTFILDGRTIGTTLVGIPNAPMHWNLQTETATDNVAPNNADAGDVQIDWVSIYRWDPSTLLRVPLTK